ncbi:MAG: DUF3793 family protein [Fusicatenibacter sp.]|nr:DUF3793 family protein [Lachnospiraceae bacterium]MDY2939230.1 DUF3793 family protein [Fusicatenibacter sp.]
MSDEMIVRHCSPTLAGLKTANLFSCPYSNKEELLLFVRDLNQRLSAKGVRVVPLRVSAHRGLLYLYRPKRLESDFEKEDTAKILKECGYTSQDCSQCLARLGKRLREREEFPHEIGLFLGYPPEDVRGFIENQAEGYKFSGCWKVYGDEQKAKKEFDRYKKCTETYCSQWERGKSIERLTVNARS